MKYCHCRENAGGREFVVEGGRLAERAIREPHDSCPPRAMYINEQCSIWNLLTRAPRTSARRASAARSWCHLIRARNASEASYRCLGVTSRDPKLPPGS